jgi:hypothetical protein
MDEKNTLPKPATDRIVGEINEDRPPGNYELTDDTRDKGQSPVKNEKSCCNKCSVCRKKESR